MFVKLTCLLNHRWKASCSCWSRGWWSVYWRWLFHLVNWLYWKISCMNVLLERSYILFFVSDLISGKNQYGQSWITSFVMRMTPQLWLLILLPYRSTVLCFMILQSHFWQTRVGPMPMAMLFLMLTTHAGISITSSNRCFIFLPCLLCLIWRTFSCHEDQM